jgi:hypothetical protein
MTNYITSVGVQQFSITIASGQTTGTATITSVGSGAFILFGGMNPSVSNDPAESFARVTLTNSTTITATRNTGTTGTIVVTGCIVDGDTTNLIKSVQYGSVTISSGNSSGTASISTVTNANTAIHLLGWSSTNASYSGVNENPILSLSGATVTATRQGTGTAITVSFVAIEFQGSALTTNAVQNIAATSSSSVTSYTASLGSNVVLANAISIYAGSNIATVTTIPAQIKQYGALTGVGTVTVNVNTAVADAKTYRCSIVEFASGVLAASVQRGTTTLTGVVSNTSTLSPSLTVAQSAISWLGNTSSDSVSETADIVEGAVALTNSTTVTVTKHTSTLNITGSWEVAEFPAFIAAGQGVGSSSGSAAVAAIGSSLFLGIAISAGSSLDLSQAGMIGLASGTSSVSGTGTSGTLGTASSSGTSSVSGTGTSGLSATAISLGSAAVAAHTAPLFIGTGISTGAAAVAAISAPVFLGTATTTGSSSVLATSAVIAASTAQAAGMAIVSGAGPVPRETVNLLQFMTNVPVNSVAEMDNGPVDVQAIMSNALPLLQLITKIPVNSTAVISNSPVCIQGNF